ncbi:MAG: ComEC/Rec2 family competence protein [Clostridia bacterium]|nr:ComEC/Rec2 family competence protein [Clostridia bacterium]
MKNNAVFNKRTFVVLALGLIVGIALGRIVHGTSHSFALCLLILLPLFLVYAFSVKSVMLFAVAATIGFMRIIVAYPIPIESGEYEVNGRIIESSERLDSMNSYILDDVALDGRNIPGKVLVITFDEAAFGDIVKFRAKTELFYERENFDELHYYAKDGIILRVYVEGKLHCVGHSDEGAWIMHIREYIAESIDVLFNDNAGLILGMLLGDDSTMNEELLLAYRNTGIAHVLAISGLHVGIFAAALMYVLKRVRPAIRISILAAFLLLYCIITAFPASLCRAALMSIIFALAPLFERRYDLLSSIFASMSLILIINPFELYDIGFQLSYSAVIGIALLSKPLDRRLIRLSKPIRAPVSLSIAASMGTFGLTTYHMGTISLLGLIANTLVVPLVPFIIVPSLIAVLIYWILPDVSMIIAEFSNFVSNITSGAIMLISDIPFASIETINPPLWWAILMFVPMVFFSDMFLIEKPKKYFISCAALIALALLLLVL